MGYSLKHVLETTGAEVARWDGPDTVEIVWDDSRRDGSVLFLPGREKGIGTPLYDYLAFIGAAGIMLPRHVALPQEERYSKLGVLLVDSVAAAHARLARHERLKSRSFVAGITGSVGKSSTTHFLANILRSRFQVHSSKDSNNRPCHCCDIIMGMNGTPDEAAVIEMGFHDIEDIGIMASAARPNAGVITQIAPQHLAHTEGSVQIVAREKCRMAGQLAPGGFMVVNAADMTTGLLPLDEYGIPIYRFGPGEGHDASFDNASAQEQGTSFELSIGTESMACQIEACGEFQAQNAAAAALVAHKLGFALPDIVDALQHTVPMPHRFQAHRFGHGFTLVDDTFGSGYYALIHAAELAARLAGARRKVALVSAFSSLGEYGQQYHRAAGKHLVECGFEHLVLLGMDQDTAALRDGAYSTGLAKDNLTVVLKASDALAVLSMFISPNTLVLCKTHHSFHLTSQMNELVAALRQSPYGPHQ